MATQYYEDDSGSWYNCFLRLKKLMIGLNVIMALIAVCAIVLGIIMRDTIEKKLRSLCATCYFAHILYMSFFGVLLGVAALGFLAIWFKNVLVRKVYLICLLVVFVLMLGVIIIAVLLFTGGIKLEGMWNGMVEKDETRACNLELKYNCSGWRTPCTSRTMASPIEKCPKCTTQEQNEIDLFNETCETAITNNFKKLANFLIPLGVVVLLISLLGMLVTYCSLKNTIAWDSDDEYYYSSEPYEPERYKLVPSYAVVAPQPVQLVTQPIQVVPQTFTLVPDT